MPGTAIAIDLGIGRLRERLVHHLPVAKRCLPVDRRTHQRMTKPHPGTELQQTRRLGRRRRLNPARMRWGERLEYVAEAGPGDFIYIPPYVPHQEINAEPSEPLSCVLARSGQEPVVVNLDLADVEPNPQQVHWVDDIHSAP